MFTRTKLSLSVVCAAALLGGFSLPGHAETAAQKSARASIEATYKKVAQAIMRKDIAPYAAAEAADYQSYSSSGVVRNRDQDIAVTSEVFASAIKISKMEYKILSLTWRGPDAVVIAQNTSVMEMKQGNRRARVEGVYVSRDFWSRTAKGWQIRQTVDKEEKVWINGKRIK